MSYTSGPWITKREGYSTVYVEARIGGGWLQEVAACGPTANGKDEQEANARLISAAPDLLAALVEAANFIQPFNSDSDLLEKLDAVIAKATGG